MLFKFFFGLLFFITCEATYALYGAHPASGLLSKAVVSLHLQDPEHASEKAFCSGVLITPTKVLTAGHCIDVIGLELYEMSTKLIYEPEILRVNILGQKVKVKSVRFATSYFDSSGFEGEDVAVIELQQASVATPISIAPKNSLHVGAKAKMIAHGQESLSVIKSMTSYAHHTVMALDGSKSGVCSGDSGGALLVERNGKYELAGILLSENQGCTKSDFWSVSPSPSSR